MKKIVASVGLVALGASGVQKACAQELLAPDDTKPWSVSATLRGFYDDNVNTWPNDQSMPAGFHRGSWGFSVSPAALLRWSMEQTTLNLGFLYSFRYYENKPLGNSSNYDQIFTFNAGLHHNFSERYQLDVRDSFVIGQEPDLLRAGDTFATYTRVPGDNIRNYGNILFDAQLTPEASLQLGYDNAYYDYADKAGTIDVNQPGFTPSLAGLLNRIEQAAHIDGLWRFAPETQGVLGFQFRDFSYTRDEFIGTDLNGNPVQSNDRNSRSYQMYLGVNHTFRPDLTASVRVGGQVTEYYNDPSSDDKVSPYAKLNVRWLYAPESYVEGGFVYDRSATDLLGNANGTFTLDAGTAALYVSVVHRITPKLFGSVIGSFQNADYNGGQFNNQSEQFYLVGLNLEYRFNPNFSASVGYNYDNLQSDVGRGFDRNRVYIGVTARY